MRLTAQQIKEAKKFQRQRDKLGTTNAKISRQLEVSESLICKIMRADRPPSAELRPRFLAVLQLQD